jgi:WXG100 family type VII secretion target
MAGSIKVDPAVLKSTAGKIDAQAAQYRQQFGQLYTEVNNMKSAWQGADNQAFTTQIESFKPEFEKMAKLMDEYSQFLKSASDAYQKTQDEIRTAASKL